MRRVIATVVATVAALVLLLSFKTHSLTHAAGAVPPVAVSSAAPSSAAPSASAAAPSATAAAPSATAAGPASTTSAAPTTKAAPTTAATTRTVAGDEVDTQFGPVQVQITVSGGKVTAATALQYPNERQRDVQINQYAVPILDAEVVKAQSAKIDMVSGATYTSQGYLQSLQSALDKAGITG